MVAPGPAEAGFPTLSANTSGQGWGTGCARDDKLGRIVAVIGVLRLPLTMFGVAQDDTRNGFVRAVAILVRHARRRGVDVLGTQAVEQRLLLAGEEAQLQPKM